MPLCPHPPTPTPLECTQFSSIHKREGGSTNITSDYLCVCPSLPDPNTIGVAIAIPATFLLLTVLMLGLYLTAYLCRISAIRRYQAANEQMKKVNVQVTTPSSQRSGQQLMATAEIVPVVKVPQHFKALSRPPSYLEAIETGNIPLPPYPW